MGRLLLCALNSSPVKCGDSIHVVTGAGGGSSWLVDLHLTQLLRYLVLSAVLLSVILFPPVLYSFFSSSCLSLRAIQRFLTFQCLPAVSLFVILLLSF